MRRLSKIFRDNTRTLKVWESPNKLRGSLYETASGEHIATADFLYADGDMDVYRVREYFGMNTSYEVPFERKKNGKIVLFPVDINRRIIWTNDNYDEWKDGLLADGEKEEELTYERFYDDNNIWLDDEHANLNIEVDGYIVAFADAGTWRGRMNGGKVIGRNVNDILSSDCDYCTWFCDRYNVRFDGIHHDGKNHYLYRVAETKEMAEKLVEKIAYRDMSEEEFRKATKSLRPYVAKVYGW